MKSISACFVTIALFATAYSAPQITISPDVYKCGEVNEGKTKSVSGKYTVRNTGDKTLKLLSVKPGCGCTVVKFDSLIAPGDSGTINASLDITGYNGHVLKNITVTSNAENTPSLRLSIDVIILSPLSITPRFISGTSETVIALAVSSTKKDLHVTDVHFKISDNTDTDDMLPWPMVSDTTLKFELIKDSTVEKSNRTDYLLKLFLPKVTTLINGTFIIHTDHLERKTVELIGAIHL